MTTSLANRFYEFSNSAIVWHEVENKLKFREIEHLLCDHLKMKDYSNEVKEYFFLFVVSYKLTYQISHFFNKKKGVLWHGLALDYAKFEAANLEEALQMQAELYLQGIKDIPKIRGMKKIAFDWERFYADAKNLFEKQTWIKKEIITQISV
ncbi:MAG: hypothetical protein EAZ97_03630 [Bacteroidetes bacterium]|nr:MAG: hypothetical protein EAZ97_03630 [Bacteroidota bacterium]